MSITNSELSAIRKDAWGMIRIKDTDMVEAIGQPKSFIVTCEYCGQSYRVMDKFYCPCCGGPCNMNLIASPPMLLMKSINGDGGQGPCVPGPHGTAADPDYEFNKLWRRMEHTSIMSKEEARKRFLGISAWKI